MNDQQDDGRQSAATSDIFQNLSATDMTELARQGKFDPVVGRDNEIRRIINILTRRSKNNPLLVGEAGVGKTAAVEGLAILITRGDVPERLKNKRIVSLDVSNLVAGTSVRGQFEQRLKQLVETITSKEDQIILFIDELHLIVGAGAAGDAALDVANILKPHLARGTIQCIGATTFGEYSKYIEKDAALARRFQKVIMPEPTVEDAIAILRGLREKFESFHGIDVRDSALVAAVHLSHRYVTDRRLPDKAIDLVDETASRRRMEVDSTPTKLRETEERIIRLELERSSLSKDTDKATIKLAESLDDELKSLRAQMDEARSQWEELKQDIQRRQMVREKIEQLRADIEDARRSGELKRAAEIEKQELANLQRLLEKEIALSEVINAGEDRHIKPDSAWEICSRQITAKDIERQISEWTGIPQQRLEETEAARLLRLEEQLNKRIVGQDDAVIAVADAIRVARAGINDPNRPIATFLFLGPSGVGKTEIAKVLTDTIFGEQSCFIRLDMSEYFDRYTVSRLIGAPPGYIGYDEGGQLSEAVRRKPFSCILFDEIEKAHPDVFNILLQILDEGRLTDAKGRAVDFKNTVVIMTSNLGSELLVDRTSGKIRERDTEAAGINPQKSDSKCGGIDSLPKELRKILLRTFRPELLNRIDEIVLFSPLSEEQLASIVDIHIELLNKRLEAKGTFIKVSNEAKRWIASIAYSPAYGARPLKRVIHRHIETPLAQTLLSSPTEEPREILIDVGANGSLSFQESTK